MTEDEAKELESYKAVVKGSRECADYWLAQCVAQRNVFKFINRTLSENYTFDELIRATGLVVDRAREYLK